MNDLREFVVGFDEGARSRDALVLGASLAQALRGELLVLRFFENGGPDSEPSLEQEVLGLLAGSDIEPRVETRDGPAVAGFASLAAPGDGRAIVLGSTHRAGLGRIYPGSVAERLLHGGGCPVVIAQRGLADAKAAFAVGKADLPPPGDGLRVLAVGFDGGPGGRSALRLAAAVGLVASATLRVIAVGGPEGSAGRGLQDQLADVVRELPAELRAQPIFAHGLPAVELAERAEEGVDLLVLGSRGEGRLDRIWLGGVSTELMRTAACPVMVVPSCGN